MLFYAFLSLIIMKSTVELQCSSGCCCCPEGQNSTNIEITTHASTSILFNNPIVNATITISNQTDFWNKTGEDLTDLRAIQFKGLCGVQRVEERKKRDSPIPNPGKKDEKIDKDLEEELDLLFGNVTEHTMVDVLTTPSMGLEDRIVNGEPAKLGAWPWQASIRVLGQHICGGSLIAEKWIVTAAHCQLAKYQRRYPTKLTAHFATLSSVSSGPFEQVKIVKSVIENKDFNKGIEYNNDIALIELDKAVVINNYVSPICLPTQSIPPGTLCYATGYGDTKGTGPRNVLNEVAVPLLSPSQCSNPRILGSFINENMLCAGGNIKDSCKGDSGGPFQCEEDTNDGVRWVLAGIVSWGQGCALINKPGVYTNVFNYLGWINNHSFS